VALEIWKEEPLQEWLMTEALDFALETARRAGGLLRAFYSQQHTVKHKSTEIDLVTEADLASERLMIDAIRARFPHHAILSEEGLGDRDVDAGEVPYLWLVDPLDGTVNYAHGFPVWSVTLALANREQVVLGVAYDPLLDEMFWAERGQGAWCNSRRLHVSTVSRLQEALLATGFAYQLDALADNNLAEFNAMVLHAQGVRRGGSAVLDLAYVAAGRLDAYWEMQLQPWDWATGWLLVEEAGGVVTDLKGEPWSLGKTDLAASNGPVHQELLAVLRQAQSPIAAGVKKRDPASS
jgi:myo-inositol-1(or 4)-monophosphatase